MINIMKTVSELKEHIQNSLQHPYLLEYISPRFIDEDRILLSLAMLESVQLSPEEARDHIIPMMLVQIALDTHDEVTNSGSDQLKMRQLTVLAGDLYSGLYYEYLARKEYIPIIGVFAKAVREINEHKIQFYQKDIERVESLFYSIGIIESALICKMAEYYDSPKWSAFAFDYLLLKRLKREREAFFDGNYAPVCEQMKKILFPNCNELTKEQANYLLHIFNQYVDHCKENLMNIELQLNNLLKKHVLDLLNGFPIMVNTTVEEG